MLISIRIFIFSEVMKMQMLEVPVDKQWAWSSVELAVVAIRGTNLYMPVTIQFFVPLVNWKVFAEQIFCPKFSQLLIFNLTISCCIRVFGFSC